MGVSAYFAWEVRDTGDDANGGGFDPYSAGTDYSQQDSAILSLSDVATDDSNNVISTSGGFTSQMIGNAINVAGSIFQITGVTSGNAVTVDRSVPNGSGQVAKVGGALATVNKSSAYGAPGNIHWLRGSVVTLIPSGYNVSGCIFFQGGYPSLYTRLVGYGTTRGDGQQATIGVTPGFNGLIIYLDASYQGIENIIFDGSGSVSGVTGTSANHAYSYIDNCTVKNCSGTGLSAAGNITRSQAINCGVGFAGYSAFGCHALNCSIGFDSGICINCIAVGGSKGFAHASAIQCVAYGQSVAGFYLDQQAAPYLVLNCIAAECDRGVSDYNSSFSARIHNCAFYDTPSGIFSGSVQAMAAIEGTIELSASPFVDPASGDFRLNSNLGGGLDCRGTGYSIVPGTPTVGFPDVGIAQHLDAGDGGGGGSGAGGSVIGSNIIIPGRITT